MKHVACGLLTVAASAISLFAQVLPEGSTAERESLASIRQYIERTRPDIPNWVLNQDAVVVHQAMQGVGATLSKERKYSKADSRAAVLFSWTDLRINELSKDQPVNEAAIKSAALSLGRLSVRSAPSSATITVDGTAWRQTTNADGFAKQGMRRIRVAKPGLTAVEQECEVREDAVTTFEATLGLAASQATCK
jgi:hypothetical protein